MHYYAFRVADYRKDTLHLNPTEHYIYRTLIDWYYLDEAPIPVETHWVTRRLCLGSDMVSVVEGVLNDFFALTKQGWLHSKIEEDLQRYRQQKERNSLNGQKGGRPKANIDAHINPLGYDPKPTLKATNNQETIINIISKPLSKYSDEFEVFWQAYPKKSAKKAAHRIWVKEKPPLDLCLTAISWQKRSAQWVKSGGTFIPMASTYLSQSRWLDEELQVIPF